GLPGMKRKYRHLNSKCEKEGPEDPCLFSRGQMQRIECLDVEGMSPRSLKPEPDEGDKHQEASCKSIDKEFKCYTNTVVATPDETDEINWNECQFPEYIE